MPPSGGGGWTTATTVSSYNNETVTLTATGDQPLLLDNKSWIIINGLRLIGAGPSVTDKIVFFWAGTHHIRLSNNYFSSSRGAVYDADASGANRSGGSNELRNNTFRTGGYNPGSLLGPAFYLESPNNIVDGNDITQTLGYCGQFYTGTGVYRNDNSVFSNNYCHDSTSDTGKTGGNGITAWNGDGIKIYNNIFASNAAHPSSSVISLNDVTNLKIYGNTFYNNAATAIHLPAGNTGEVRNNILWNNCTGKDCYGNGELSDSSAGGFTNSNNLCTTAAVGCSVTSDPLFVSTTPGVNFLKLTASSPAKDAAISTLGSPYDVDYAGNTRTAGAWDIGAYEYQAPGIQLAIDLPANCSGTSSACTTTLSAVTLTGTSSLP